MTGAIQIVSVAALDVDVARRLILGSEPWRTLGYGEREVDALVRGASGGRILVARAGDRVVGFALSQPAFLLGEYLKLLVIDPAERSRSIGRQLMAELERCAFERWPNVYLCVSDFNAGAQRFYRRLGYEEVGVLHDFFLPGKGEVLMRKSIGAWRHFEHNATRMTPRS
jgi:ribosomal protein S18 acetylase RimI-like enzyme